MVELALDECSYCVAEGGTVDVVVSRGADGLGDVTFGKNIMNSKFFVYKSFRATIKNVL